MKSCFEFCFLISSENYLFELLDEYKKVKKISEFEINNSKLKVNISLVGSFTPPPIHPNINIGMTLLRDNYWNESNQKKLLIFLKSLQMKTTRKLVGD
jgi:hypothetical protein